MRLSRNSKTYVGAVVAVILVFFLLSSITPLPNPIHNAKSDSASTSKREPTTPAGKTRPEQPFPAPPSPKKPSLPLPKVTPPYISNRSSNSNNKDIWPLFPLINKSLGYNQNFWDTGHQCDFPHDSNFETSFLNFTPNRLALGSVGQPSSVLIAVLYKPTLSETLTYFDQWVRSVTKWQERFFARDPRMAIVVLFNGQFERSVVDFPKRYSFFQEFCTEDSTPQQHETCRQFEQIDDGYQLYQIPTSNGPRLVMVGRLPNEAFPVWERRGFDQTRASQSLGYKDCLGYIDHHGYKYGTNAYAAVMRLRVLDFFDFFWKIDHDFQFLENMPDQLTLRLAAQQSGPELHGPVDPDAVLASLPSKSEPPALISVLRTPDSLGVPCVYGLADLVDFFLSMQSLKCKRLFEPVEPLQLQDAQWVRDMVVGSFMGGALRLWTSPQVLLYSDMYWNWPEGIWRHRWGDQQFYMMAFGFFHKRSELLDWNPLTRYFDVGHNGVWAREVAKNRGEIYCNWNVPCPEGMFCVVTFCRNINATLELVM